MPTPHVRRTAKPRMAVAVALGALLAVLLPVAVASAKPAPVPGVASAIRIDSVGEPSTVATSGTKDLWYVVQGRGFPVALTFVNAGGTATPLSTNQTVTVAVKYGTTTLGTTDVPPGTSTARLDGLKIATAASNVRLTVTAATKPKALTAVSRFFDVLLTDTAVATGALTSIGGGSTGAPCVPAPGTVCGDLFPPAARSFGAGGLLSLGLCGGACPDKYVQALVVTNATPTDPATLVMKCDKDACGTGSIKREKLVVTLAPGSLTPNDPLAADYAAPPCGTKGVVSYDPGLGVSAANLPFCVDYVQSTRDNAGNTVLYLLFVDDAKVRFS
jgi:hypothetical protein